MGSVSSLSLKLNFLPVCIVMSVYFRQEEFIYLFLCSILSRLQTFNSIYLPALKHFYAYGVNASHDAVSSLSVFIDDHIDHIVLPLLFVDIIQLPSLEIFCFSVLPFQKRPFVQLLTRELSFLHCTISLPADSCFQSDSVFLSQRHTEHKKLKKKSKQRSNQTHLKSGVHVKLHYMFFVTSTKVQTDSCIDITPCAVASIYSLD